MQSATNSKLLRQAAVWGLVAFAWYFVYQRLASHTNKNNEDLPNSFEPFIDISVIDLSPFHESAQNEGVTKDKIETAQKISEASMKYGSFYVSIPNHKQYNINYRNQLLSNAYNLFKIDTKSKQLYSAKPNNSRGFILYGTETGSRHYFEHKEGFSYGYYNWSQEDKYVPRNEMEAFNVFPPTQNKHIETSFNELFDIFVEISYILMRAYSIALYGDEHVLMNEFKGGETISMIRLFHYFSIQHKEYLDKVQNDVNSDMNAYLGSSPHTDWGLLTLIIADDVNGLQLSLNNKWYTIKPKFNESLIFVNCGDFMSMLSDAQFISPLHRVLSPINEENTKADEERMSFVFFFYPEYDAKIPKMSKTISREYSLFQDQSKTDNSLKTSFDANISFGSYIKEKWKQVASQQKPK